MKFFKWKIVVLNEKQAEEIKRSFEIVDRVNRLYWFSEFKFMLPIFDYLQLKSESFQPEFIRDIVRKEYREHITNNEKKIALLEEHIKRLASEKKQILETIELKKAYQDKTV